VKAATATKQKTAALAELVDELGTLEKRARNFKPVADRIETLRKLLRASAASLPASEVKTVFGKQYTAYIGACGDQRTVNVKKLSELVSSRAFVGLATVTLGSLDQVAPEVCAAVIESHQTGSRSLKVVETAPAS